MVRGILPNQDLVSSRCTEVTISIVCIAYSGGNICCKRPSETDEDVLGALALGRSTSDRAEGRRGTAVIWLWRLGGDALCSNAEASQRYRINYH